VLQWKHCGGQVKWAANNNNNNNNLSLSVRALCLADAKERQNGKTEFVEFNSFCMTKH
jgi:hypothetical protein